MAFTDEQINEINRKLKEKGIKDSQFAQAHSLTGGEKVPILQDAENRLMDVTQFQMEVADIPEFKSDDNSVRVDQQLRSVDFRAKCYMSNEESGWAESPLFFEDENCTSDTGSCKNFQRFILNDMNGRVIKVDIIAKKTIESPNDITIKTSGDIEETDLFELTIGTSDDAGYYGSIKFKSKYANTSLDEDMLFLQAVSDKSNTYPFSENVTELLTIEGSLKTYEVASKGGLTGRTAKASLIDIEGLLNNIISSKASFFGVYNQHHDWLEWLGCEDYDYEDYEYEEEVAHIPEGLLSYFNKTLGYSIDTLNNGIDLDEITPKILTETDDLNIGLFEFIQAYSQANGYSFNGGSQYNERGLSKSTSSKSNTKMASPIGDSQPPLWEHNAVFIKHDNDVMKCIEDNFIMFLEFMFAMGSAGDHNFNADSSDYVNEYQQEPMGINPYHRFSGTYLTSGFYNDVYGGGGGSIGQKSKTSSNTKSATRKSTKEAPKKMTHEEYKSQLAEFYRHKKNETPTLRKSVQTKVTTSNDEESDVPEFPYEVKTEIDCLNDILMIPFNMDDPWYQTINIKKHMVAFYKLMKVFSIMSDPDRVIRQITDNAEEFGVESLSHDYKTLVMLAISGQRDLDAFYDYIDDKLEELDGPSWNGANIGNDMDVQVRLAMLTVADRDKYQAFMKEVYDAIYDFDILLGNGQNMPYEDTCSFFFKIKDTWYELITPLEVGTYVEPRLQPSIFEPNREFKLVHLGDWKHCGDNNSAAQDLNDVLNDEGATMDDPIDARYMVYDEFGNSENSDDNPGGGNNNGPILV